MAFQIVDDCLDFQGSEQEFGKVPGGDAESGVLTLPLILSTGNLRSALSLQLLVPGMDGDGWLYGFLNGLNLFGLWTMVALGIGISRIYPKVSAGSAISLLVGMYVLLKAVFAAF